MLARWWRDRPRQVVIICAVIEVMFLAYGGAGAALHRVDQNGPQLFWVALDLFLLWRIWRGGRIAWRWLVTLNALAVLLLIVAAAFPWDRFIVGLFALELAQTALLLSPAVRRHVSGNGFLTRVPAATDHR